MNTRTDEQLVEQYLSGENQALELLIQRYLNIIYRFVQTYVKNQDEAEDVTQEIFVKVWKSLKSFQPAYKFRPWLFAIAKNTALDFLKKKQPLTFSELSRADELNFEENLADQSGSVLDRLKWQETFRALQLAAQSLPANYRATLDLRYDQNLKFREIAELLDESIDTVKTRHRRAIEFLKKRILP
jgi:RNA polymerase sigma-70 factor (ECF subfamily)